MTLINVKFSSLKLVLNPVHEHLDDNSLVNNLCKTRLTKFLISVPPIVVINVF